MSMDRCEDKRDESNFRMMRKQQVLKAYLIVLINSRNMPNWIKYTYGEKLLDMLISITEKLVMANRLQWTSRPRAVSLAREASLQFDAFKTLSDELLDFGNLVGFEKADESDTRFIKSLAALKEWSGINFNIKTSQREYFSYLRTDFGKSLGSWLKAIQLTA